jgi:hypothetical protein
MKRTPKTLTTYEISLYIAFMGGARPNSCFKDAWEAFINFPQWFRRGTYVEGWVLIEVNDEIEVIEHGWCTLPDGTIVDPAIVLLVGPDVPVLYFTGIEYTWEETLSFENEWLPRVRFTQYGSDGMEHADYKAAHDDAKAEAQMRAADSGKRIATHVAKQLDEEDHQNDGISVIVYIIPPGVQN